MTGSYELTDKMAGTTGSYELTDTELTTGITLSVADMVRLS